MTKFIKILYLLVVLFAIFYWKLPENVGANYRSLPENERKPSFFEPYLLEHPNAQNHRAAALVWYSRHERYPEKMFEHTKELFHRNPYNRHILDENMWLLLIDKDYLYKLANFFKSKIKDKPQNHNIHWLLAQTYLAQAVPFHDGTTEGRAKMKKWFGIPSNAVLVSKNDPSLIEASSKYFRLAIKYAHLKDSLKKNNYIREYCQLLYNSGKVDEALSLLQTQLSSLNSLKPTKKYSEILIGTHRQQIIDLIEKYKEKNQKP